MHVLIADDDRRLSRLLERGLEAEGHRVDLAADGAEALALARQGGFDVIVLDVMMPLADGFAVARELRDRADDTPVLMLTARGEVEDRVRGLDLGADDYLVKPFDFDELLARLRALDRRRSGAEGATLSAGPITVDLLKLSPKPASTTGRSSSRRRSSGCSSSWCAMPARRCRGAASWHTSGATPTSRTPMPST